MKRFATFLLLAFTLLLAGCAEQTPDYTASNTESNANAAAAPATEMAAALEAAENSAYEAWKNKDSKFFETFLAEKYVGLGANGPVGRDAAVKQMADSPCDVKSVKIGDGSVLELDENTALFTSKNESDFTCNGVQGPSATYTATIYVKDGEKWSAAYHQNVTAADAEVQASAPPAGSAAPKKGEAAMSEDTTALAEVDSKLWDGFAKGDTKPFEELLSDKFVHITSNGRQDKAESIKGISEAACEIKSHKLDNFSSTKIGNGMLLTYHATQDGKCGDEALPANSWVTSYLMKEGDGWKVVYHMETPVPSADAKKEEPAAESESDA